jgi:type I restriction enzyme R subunit
MPTDTSEHKLEDIIVDYLRDVNGYEQGVSSDYKPEWGFDTGRLEAFLLATQRSKVEQSGIFSTPSKRKAFLERVRSEVSKRGVVDVLRNGVKHGIGFEFSMYYPLPDAANQTAQRQYAANRFVVIRQLHFSNNRPDDSLDVALFINGLPVITMELKNQLTRQDADCAIKQYCERDARELIYAPKRAAVHFAVDDNVVMMCSELRGEKSWFLPFNKGLKDPTDHLGRNDGAGNPVNPNGLKTDYLWHDILTKKRLSTILEQYARVIKKKNERTGKTTEQCIWPRYHQLDVVTRLEDEARHNNTASHRYLIQHSAGSGKSNSITWLAFRLTEIKDADNNGFFNSVIVVTDRVNLDGQIRANINAFADPKIRSIIGAATSSTELKDALEAGKKIIVTTVHKFPYIMETVGVELRDKRFAIIIDEAHSSQSGSMATALNRVMAGLGAPLVEENIEDDEDALNELLQEVIKGKRMAQNANFYAFTATPKNKTLETFGTQFIEDGQTKFRPFHNYSMKQAIEEGFILDVLKNYTTYHSFHKIRKKNEELQGEYDRNQAQKKLHYWVESQPETVAKKAEIMVAHFHEKVCHILDGEARCMIVTSSIERAIDYFQEVNRLLLARQSRYKAIVAFSGDKTINGVTFTEESLNGFPSSKIEETFASGDYRFLIVADKFQTGYDEPLLCAMYVDKGLSSVKTVQTLSRLNRAMQKKKTFVLDFFNTTADIQKDFQRYYRTTILTGETDVNKLNDLIDQIKEVAIFEDEEVERFNHLFWTGGERDTLDPILDVVVERFKNDLDDETKIKVKSAIKAFVRTYDFLITLLPSGSVEMEKLHTFLRFLVLKLPKLPREDWTEGLIESVSYSAYRSQKQGENNIMLNNENGEVAPVPTGTTTVGIPQPDLIPIDEVVDDFNLMFGNIDWQNEDAVRRQVSELAEAVSKDQTVINSSRNGDIETASQDIEDSIRAKIGMLSEGYNEFFLRFYQNEDVQRRVISLITDQVIHAINPDYDEADIIAKMRVDLESDFSQLCGVHYRNLDEILNMMFKVINAETVDSLDGLNSILRKRFNLIYRAKRQEGDNRDHFNILLGRYEAYLRKLYFLREGHEYVSTNPRSGLVDIVRQFRSLQGLYHNQDARYANFKQYYDMLYSWRNEDTHTAPVLEETQLPAAIHILVAMYVYATMISATDIEERL